MRIAVVGLGQIGLPLAVQYASRGHDVVGCDVDTAVVDAVNVGRPPHPGEAEVDERLPNLVAAGRLRATTDDRQGVGGAEAVVIIVPVAVDEARQVDFGAIDAATRDVGAGIGPGTLVVFETTLPVGTTRERLTPVLARESGLTQEQDLFVAFSPERVLVGRVLTDLRRYPKVVGGIGPESSRRAAAFYEQVLDVGTEIRTVSSAEAAEMTKLAETTYRDVNIALANEYARFAAERGIDVMEVIDAANSQPYSHVHRPGVGVGGHCIPVYPYFLFADAPGFQLPPAARRVNDGMAGWAVAAAGEALGGLSGVPALVLGIAYRGDVREDAFSSAFALRDALRAAGAEVHGHDPYFSAEELRSRGFEPWQPGGANPIRVAFLQADHAAYHELDLAAIAGLELVVDGRNALDPGAVRATGRRYLGIGR
ncbi:MAG TPA: nucleotide sugar dehydrogenase [Candidatus Limnocylindria bacterium]|nr:nucleotide sugar dehydrogenase [Candidatus Limnocylindria bacterium]